jgi:two-component system nitrogen regulation response regulator GlnG
MGKLLVIDDEPGVLYSFRQIFSNDDSEVLTAPTAAEGLRQFRAHHPEVLVLDLQLPDRSGMEVFEEVRVSAPKLPVIFITAHGTTQTAIEAMKRGAFDYLVKPVDFAQMHDLLRRAFEAARLMQVPAVLPTLEPIDQIVGRSPVMQEMCKSIGRVAPQEVNALILGESGVGKELVARAIYHHSQRSNRPFLALNCAALPDQLVESELFGHEKGAFTGADRRRIGKFEQCNGGTLFLDEIGDMPLPAQAKILRLLQEQRFERVGGTETIQTNVRVLAATNQDLERLIAQGKFRSDLYYRLKVVTIAVPPLRQRSEDIPELAHHFLYQFNRELGMSLRGFDAETLAGLQRYSWPGNVRELQSAVQEAMLRASGLIVLAEYLAPNLRGGAAVAPLAPLAPLVPEGRLDLTAVIEDLLRRGEAHLYERVLQTVERVLFTRVLRETGGHQGQASERLGLNRSTLRYKLRELGLSADRAAGDDLPPGKAEKP